MLKGPIVGDFSSFLFARPSLIEGAARILDFSGALDEYNTSPTGEEADRRALEADWRAVGHDIEEAQRKEGPSRTL